MAAPRAIRLLGDGATLAILAIVAGAVGFALPQAAPMWLLHVGMFAAFAALIPAMNRWPVLRGLATVAVMFTLYGTLAQIPFEIIPWSGDDWLALADHYVPLASSLVLRAERFATPGTIEFFSFIYAFFIPYLYLSILSGLVGRPDLERSEFIAGFALTYSISFLGYLFLPARGPIVFQAAEFAAPLSGGFFHGVVLRSVDSLGGPHGAFPSLHIAATTYLCLFDLQRNLIRGLTYLPLIPLIAVATVLLRYHYVVDLLAGLAIAILATRIARVRT